MNNETEDNRSGRNRGDSVGSADTIAQLRLELEEKNNDIADLMAFRDQISDYMPMGVFFKDPRDQFRYIFWNQVMERMTAIPRQDVIGKTDFDLFPMRWAQMFLESDLESLKAKDRFIVPVNLRSSFGLNLFGNIIKIPLKKRDGEVFLIMTLIEDLSRLRDTENRLDKTKTHLQAILHHTRFAFILFDLNGFVLALNPPVRDISSCLFTKRPRIGDHYRDFVDEDYIGVFDGGMRQNPGHSDDRVECSVGRNSDICYEMRWVPVLSENGDTESISLSIQDISDRRRTEDELRRGEERYRHIVEHTLDVFWTADTNLNFTYISPNIESLLGYTATEILGIHPLNTMDEKDALNMKTLLNQAISDYNTLGIAPKKSILFEVDRIKKDGSRIRSEISASLVFDAQGKPVGVAGVTRDVSNRWLAEKKIRESEHKLSFLLQHTPIAYIEVSLNMKIVAWNEASQSMFGFRADEVINENFVDTIVPQTYKIVMRDILEEIGGSGQPIRMEIESTTKDRTGFHGDWSLTPLRSIDNHPLGTAILVQDITSLKITEKALKRTRDELEKRVETRTLRLNKLNQQLIEEINSRQRVEKNLKEKLGQIEALVQSIPALVYVKDDQLRYSAVNKAFCTFWDRAPEVFLNQTDAGVFTRDERNTILTMEKKVLSSQKPLQDFEWPVHNENGDPVWLKTSIIPFFDEDGKVIGLVGTSMDITEHKITIEKVKLVEESHYSMLSAFPDPVIRHDERGKVYETFVPDECQLPGIHDIRPGDSLYDAKIPASIRDVLSRRKSPLNTVFTWEFPVRAPEQTRWFEGRSLQITSGDFITIIRDQTRRKEMEIVLSEAKDKLELIIQAARMHYWEWDNEAGFDTGNFSLLRSLGYAPESIEYDYRWWESNVHPDDLKRTQDAVKKHSDGATPWYETEYRLKTADGQWRWFLALGKIVSRDATGLPNRMVGGQIDIDRIKKAELAGKLFEERYRLIADLFADYIYIGHILPNGSVIADWVVGDLFEVTGYTMDEINAMPMGFAGIVTEESNVPPDSLLGFSRDYFTKQEILVSEYHIRRKDGELVPVKDILKALGTAPVIDNPVSGAFYVIGATTRIVSENQRLLHKHRFGNR